jgi:large subunit ribosomal protein L22
MSGPKTNEREGTRAVLRYSRVAPNKVREVLNLIRGKHVQEAAEILRFSERDVAITVGKLLASAVANAEANDGQDPEELYVSACFADEGTTIKRWRPRARGRATRIRKRTSHITIIVSRLPEDRLARLQVRRQVEQSARRARRVAGARKSAAGAGGAAARGAAPGRGRLRRRRGGPADAELDTETEIDQVAAGVAPADEDEAVDEEVAEVEAAEVLAEAEVEAAEVLAEAEVEAAEVLAEAQEQAAEQVAEAEEVAEAVQEQAAEESADIKEEQTTSETEHEKGDK